MFTKPPLLHNRLRWPSFLRLAAAALLLTAARTSLSQTLDDGIMLARGTLCAGALYTNSHWSQYWEGSLERTNGNIGTVTSQSVSAMANYGITNRINVLASAPYIWTNASKGVLHSQSGFQDFTLAAKFNALQLRLGNFGSLRAIGLVAGSLPMTSYSPDQMPLSIGTHSKTATGRALVNLLGHKGLYVNGSAAYMLHDTVTLDRPYYYTNGQLYLTNQVAMPNTFEYAASVGYYHRDLKIVGDFTQQQTRGGGDIRRQDMPFVSNRMNYSSTGFEVQYPIPHLRSLQYWVAYNNVFQGRNVGQSNTVTTGLMITYQRERRTAP